MAWLFYRKLFHLKFRLFQPSAYIFYQSKGASSINIASVRNEDDKHYISTLFVPGKFAGEMYQIVKPTLDVDYIVKNTSEIERSCKYRGIQLYLNDVIVLLRKWQLLKDELESLFRKDREYNIELKRLDTPESKNEFETLTQEHLESLPRLQKLKSEVFDLEDVVMPLAKRIPNVLHPQTPVDCTVYETCYETLNRILENVSHVTIGEKMKCLEFSDVSPTAYFLKGPLAELELTVAYFFNDTFMKHNFALLSGIDFCKSFIKEAIGLDPYFNDHCIPIAEKRRTIRQKQNLVGGSSLETFCAYLTNMNISKTCLPLKYISTGRSYNAMHRNSVEKSLFSVVQSTNVHFCILCSSSDAETEFNEMFNKILYLYEQLRIPFRTADVLAQNLSVAESRRKEIQLWSPASQQYVMCSYVSHHGDFLSRRLQITFGDVHKVENYCSIIEGIIVNVPIAIGCIMENNQKADSTFDFPKVLKDFEIF